MDFLLSAEEQENPGIEKPISRLYKVLINLSVLCASVLTLITQPLFSTLSQWSADGEKHQRVVVIEKTKW